jgi:hypothetical protein
MKQLLAAGTKFKYRLGHFFEPYWTDDITGDPVLVKSMDHLHTLTRENGLTMKPGPEKLR